MCLNEILVTKQRLILKKSNRHLHACEMIIINYKLNMACRLNNFTISCNIKVFSKCTNLHKGSQHMVVALLIIFRTIQNQNVKTIIIDIHVTILIFYYQVWFDNI
jgi:hypothetical protein